MESQSRSERITAELRGDILRGRYRPGERLPSERDLAERFGVHRSSVREALKKLEQLGIATIRPGGARVAPLEDASLDVVEHLLYLDETPDPEIADQMIEVFAGLFGLSGRLGTERATEEQRRAIHDQIERLCQPELQTAELVENFHRLSDLFIEAAGNMVLALVRKRLVAHMIDPSSDERLRFPPAPALRVPLLRKLGRAVDDQDGSAAAEAIHDLTTAIRRNLHEVLTAARAAGDER
jgi:GntR family transcriptional repressor for pyruvate dehydrogenase complex